MFILSFIASTLNSPLSHETFGIRKWKEEKRKLFTTTTSRYIKHQQLHAIHGSVGKTKYIYAGRPGPPTFTHNQRTHAIWGKNEKNRTWAATR